MVIFLPILLLTFGALTDGHKGHSNKKLLKEIDSKLDNLLDLWKNHDGCCCNEQNLCPGADWTYAFDKCFKFFDTKVHQPEARAYCSKYNGHLASVHSEEENNFLNELSNKQSFWLGGYVNTTLKWYDGSTVDYENWGINEPTGDGECVNMWPDSTWNDRPCVLQDWELPYICQTSTSTTSGGSGFNVTFNNTIDTIPSWGPGFIVSFDLYVYEYNTSAYYNNIIRFASNTECDYDCYGTRVPAMWVSTDNFFKFRMALDDIYNYPFNYYPANTTGIWYNIEMKQDYVNDWVYEIKIDGETIFNKTNNNPQTYQNVVVSAGDDFSPAAIATIRNLKYENIFYP